MDRPRLRRGSFLPEVAAYRLGLQPKRRAGGRAPEDPFGDKMREFGVPVYDHSVGQIELGRYLSRGTPR